MVLKWYSRGSWDKDLLNLAHAALIVTELLGTRDQNQTLLLHCFLLPGGVLTKGPKRFTIWHQAYMLHCLPRGLQGPSHTEPPRQQVSSPLIRPAQWFCKSNVHLPECILLPRWGAFVHQAHLLHSLPCGLQGCSYLVVVRLGLAVQALSLRAAHFRDLTEYGKLFYVIIYKNYGWYACRTSMTWQERKKRKT